MEYKEIVAAYKDLFGFACNINSNTFSTDGLKIHLALVDFLENMQIKKNQIEGQCHLEEEYLSILYEYLQDLIEDLEDLDDLSFKKHKEEYITINRLLNQVIALLAHDDE